jgi:hypothetical protein
MPDRFFVSCTFVLLNERNNRLALRLEAPQILSCRSCEAIAEFYKV